MKFADYRDHAIALELLNRRSNEWNRKLTLLVALQGGIPWRQDEIYGSDGEENLNQGADPVIEYLRQLQTRETNKESFQDNIYLPFCEMKEYQVDAGKKEKKMKKNEK